MFECHGKVLLLAVFGVVLYSEGSGGREYTYKRVCMSTRRLLPGLEEGPTMVRRTKQEAHETRNRILDAAEQVFHDRGVAHASLEDVAAAAKVTRGAIYWHFKDKAELFDAMMQRVVLPSEAMEESSGCPVGGATSLAMLRDAAVGVLMRTA